jgi:hypothetical protein
MNFTPGAWRHRRREHRLSTVYQIDVTLQAGEQLAQVVGLRRLVRQKLTGIAETAEQMLILQGGFFPGPSLLQKIVDGWLVHYELDPERRRITVLSIEPRGAPGTLHGVLGPLQKRTA